MSDQFYNIDLIALHITEVCSHKCPFCYSAIENRRPIHPDIKDLKLIVNEIKKAEVKEISFLGGDPVTYPKVIELAEYVNNSGITCSILSNTLSFPGSSIETASKYFSSFETTIHHVLPEKHDEVCKKNGAYAFVINQLRKAGTLGRRTGIAINIVPEISDKIYDLVERIVSIEKVNLDYIIIQRIIPFGRALNSSNFTITRKQAEKAINEIKKIDQNLNIKITVEDPFPLCVLPDDVIQYMNPCLWGFTKAAINSKGDLSRCGADPRYRLGNIFNSPLLDIWNSSPILQSFRSRNYLPGRCKICFHLDKCGGGCPLSCEIEKDHGIDYLFLEYEKLDKEIHGEISFSNAKEEELSSILQIEWSDFPGYGHIFSVKSIKYWYNHNPRMFWVVKDSRNWVLGYATLVPVTKKLFNEISQGKYSSLNEFPVDEVLKTTNSNYYHIEVLATVPSRTGSRAGRYLIKNVCKKLINKKFITTSPITDIGLRLCKFFDFEYVSQETINSNIYPIYRLKINKEIIIDKILKF